MPFSNIQPMGRPLTIKDEGVSLNSDVGSIDFVGGGVAGSAVGSDITEDISGLQVETPLGDVNNVNTVFTVSNIPKFITLNGQIVYEDNGYTRSGLTITIDSAPFTGNVLRSHY